MNADDVLKYGNLTLLGTLDGLPFEAWNTPGVCGIWSVKDIIAHLASFEHMLVDVLNSVMNDHPTPTLDQYRQGGQVFNDQEVTTRQSRSAQEVLDEYEQVQAQTMALIAQIPVEKRRENGILPWYGAEYDLEDYIAYSFYGHKREHSAQVAVYRDLIKS